jgi:antirestriction protein ArdC
MKKAAVKAAFKSAKSAQKAPQTSNQSVYEEITARIVAQLDKGEIPWARPWVLTNPAINYVSRRPYSILNSMLLPLPGEYLSEKQIIKLGGEIKKGETPHKVVFAKKFGVEKKTAKKGNGGKIEAKSKTKVITFLRFYEVYHLSQVSGVETKIKETAKVNNPIEKAEKIIADYVERSKVIFKVEKSNMAFYNSALDKIVVPELKQFYDANSFYAVAFHEMAHSTGHRARLNREKGVANYFGSENYGREELCAEIASANIMAAAGLETEKTFKDTVAYVQNWKKAIKNDPQSIVKATQQAKAAANLILNRMDTYVREKSSRITIKSQLLPKAMKELAKDMKKKARRDLGVIAEALGYARGVLSKYLSFYEPKAFNAWKRLKIAV